MAHELQKKLGFWSVLAVVVGSVVASSTLVSLGQGLGIAGLGFLIAMLAAWLLQHFSAQTYAELACMMPSAGGIRSYTRIALGALPAIVASISGFLIPNLLVAPTELAVAGNILANTFGHSIIAEYWGVILLVFVVFMNVVGVDIFSRLQIFLTVVMMVTLAVMGIVGIFELGNPIPHLSEVAFTNPLGWKIFGLTALAIWLYTGIEFVAPMAEETINANKNIPRAMVIGLILIFGVHLLYGFATLKYVPMDQLAASNAPHLLVAKAILGPFGEGLVSIVSVFASLSIMNSVTCVVPRILYGMGINKELPRIFGAVHRTFKTPFVSILFMGAGIGAFYLGGIAKAQNLIVYVMAGCSSWLLCYIIAHIDLIVLRFRYPNANRPYRSVLYPIPQIIGSLGLIYCIFNMAPTPEMAPQIYTIAGVLVGIAVLYGFIWLKFVQKIPLFQPLDLDKAEAEWITPTFDDDEDEMFGSEPIFEAIPVKNSNN